MGKIVRKTYGIFGMVEHSVLIGPASCNVRIEFKNGRISVRGVEPCTFTTDNPAVQSLIEQTDKFKKKYIVVVSKKEIEVVDDAPADDAPADDAPADDAPADDAECVDAKDNASVSGCASNTFDNVKNSQQAKKVLMEVYRVSLSELGNVDEVREKATSLGVSFPNWK